MNMIDPIKSYIFIWYIDVADISNGDISSYMESVKKTLGGERKLEDMLNGEVVEYFIPCRNILPRLEVLEFNINSFEKFSRNPEHLEAKLLSLRSKMEELIKTFSID